MNAELLLIEVIMLNLLCFWHHFDNETVFSGLLPTIQNDLINSIQTVMIAHI